MTLPIRKLERPEEDEKRRKRNTLILSVIMIGILLFSTVGYFSLQNNNGDSSSSGNDKVQNIGGSWVVQYGDQSLTLSNSPESGKNVSLLFISGLDRYYGKTVYVASSSDAELYEVTSTLGRYTQRIQQACYGDCNKNLPEKNCNDTVIVLKGFNETQNYGNGKVYEEGNCTFVEGGLVATDAFLYRLFGVN